MNGDKIILGNKMEYLSTDPTTWESGLDIKDAIIPQLTLRQTLDRVDGFVAIPEIWNNHAIDIYPKTLEIQNMVPEDVTVLVFDRNEFLDGVDKDDMIPALLLTDRKADNLLKKVVENAVDNLQFFNKTGTMLGIDQELFDHIDTCEEEIEGDQEVSAGMTPAAAKVIDRMVCNAQSLLMDTLDRKSLDTADSVSIEIEKNRLKIKLIS